MEGLSNDQLIEAYIKAIELHLDGKFQLLLVNEIRRRKIIANHLFNNSHKHFHELKKN